MANFVRLHSDELKAQVVKLWNEGGSARDVANQVGLTRNAIIGIVHRMKDKGFEVRSEKPAVVAQAKKTRTRKRIQHAITTQRCNVTLYMPKAAEKHSAPIAPVPTNTSDRWVSLAHTGAQTCRYTEDGKLFCNAAGFPWCADHRKRVYASFKPLG
jgi:hypothetical protein